MTQQRRRLWLPWSTGDDEVSLAASSSTRIFIASVNETEVGRQLENFTVERMVFNVGILANTGPSVVTCGILMQSEDVLQASVSPSGDPGADWLWFEEYLTTNAGGAPHTHIFRDIRSRRKTRGNDSEAYFMVDNRESAATINFHTQGRMLVLL